MVKSLESLATIKVLRECWNNSNASKHLTNIFYTYDRKQVCIFNSDNDHKKPFASYKHLIMNILGKILQLEIPRQLTLHLGYSFLEFEREARYFCELIKSKLFLAPKKFFEYCIESLAVESSGSIDKEMTFINIFFGNPTIPMYLSPKYTAFFCIELSKLKYYAKDRVTHKWTEELEDIFLTPTYYWELRQQGDRPDMSQFLYCATRGPVEAMEYFWPKLRDDEKEQELSRAATHLIKQDQICLEKLLFFYKTMQPSTWNVFVTRYFYMVMTIFLSNHQYGHMTVDIYNNVKEKIYVSSIRSVLDFLIEQYSVDFESQPGGNYRANMIFDDIEPIFYSIWRLIPPTIQGFVSRNITRYINSFLHRNRFKIIASLIELGTFNEDDQVDLVYHVVKTLIVTNKSSHIDEFLAKLSKKPHFNPENIKAGYLSYSTFAQFIIFGDNCDNTASYDALLRTKYTDDEISRLKVHILNDIYMLQCATRAIRYNMFTISNFYQLINWCCSGDYLLIYKFTAENFDVIQKVYKYNLIHSTVPPQVHNHFFLMERQMKKISTYIAEDKESLETYCLELILNQKYSWISKCLCVVFETEESKIAFLEEFFRSSYGRRAICCMLTDYEFDDRIHEEYDFHKKMADLTAFKKHWVLSIEIREAIESILDSYEVPELNQNQEDSPNQEVALLPHERIEDYLRICQENRTAVRILLRESEEEFHRIIQGQ